MLKIVDTDSIFDRKLTFFAVYNACTVITVDKNCPIRVSKCSWQDTKGFTDFDNGLINIEHPAKYYYVTFGNLNSDFLSFTKNMLMGIT